jgi:hypothetical protein
MLTPKTPKIQEISSNEPHLYGIKWSNRRNKNFWGKNEFNSSFPASLACKMRDEGKKAVYVYVDKNGQIANKEISIDDVFGTSIKNSELDFLFESKYEPYQSYVSGDDIGKIDLVIRDHQSHEYLRALEVKLTVIPDNNTADLPANQWATEMVIRPASTSYCALGIWDSISKSNGSNKINCLLYELYNSIHDWRNANDVFPKMQGITERLSTVLYEFNHLQKPFLLHPIWKTKGKSPFFDDNCFDLFIWSDFALCHTFINKAKEQDNSMNRYMRSCARLARILYEFSNIRNMKISNIYTEMTYGLQTDKEFAINGSVTIKYLLDNRRIQPIYPPSILSEIILNDGLSKLSPERRLDQSIFIDKALSADRSK